ncbi:beta strand repeat-containing protein, partial [Maribacter stanieri]|uniref:beta strand repeat-containing protein n=1 Tax=Maribacter stanieri TaxID=440514 RepID=UPI003CD0C87F
MKAIILFIFFTILTVSTVFGQIKIGDNPQNIDPTSVLELESTSKVLVITRVSTLEMEAITPQRGGMVYNTDTECINYYDGTQWINLCDAVNFTITNDPIINGRSTIEITESAGGYNLEVAKNSILGDNIIDGGIGPDDIQDNSITQDKLAAESVGSSELRQNSVGTEEIRDGSIAPADIANFLPGQVLTTDENGIVQWQDSNELYDLTFNKLDNTLTISRSTTAGVSTIDLAALVGSDDQILTLTDNTLSLENDPNDIDLSTYLQQLSINAAGDEISLTNGGTITLPNPTIDTDEQNLGTTTLANEILTITIENGDPTTADLTPFATDAVVTAGLALKENIANKSNDVTLGNSTDLYPTQNAVKTYVDNTVGGSAQTIVSTDPNNSITQSVNDGGAFYNDDDGDSQNELQDLNFNPVTNILTISTPLTTGNEVNLSALAGGGALNDGQIFVGNNLNTPTGVDVGGDLTMNNIGQFSIVNNVIDNDNIINNSITLEDLNQNGATNGQVIKWDETLNAGLGAWAVANDNTGGTGSTVTSDDNTISGDGVNTSLQIKDDGVTSTQIADGTISATDLALGAVGTDNILDGTISSIDIANKNITLEKMADGTAAGQLLQWDGTNWVYITEADITATVTEVDGIIGNEVSVAADATLVLSGAGTNADPLALDVAPLGIDTAELAAGAVTLPKMADGTAAGQLLQWDGTNWVYITEADITATVTEV